MARVFTANLVRSGGSKWGELRLDITPGTPNIANNTTPITYELYVQRTATNFGGYYSGNASTATLTINGTPITVSSFTYDFGTNYKKSLKTGSMTITHDANGTKTVSASGSVTMAGEVPSGSGSGSLALTTIPRSSSFTLGGSTQTGSNITVSITRASTNFTHRVWWRVGGGSWTHVTSSGNVATSVSFTVPHDTFPNATGGTITVALQTYDGTTAIGAEQHRTRTLTIPASSFTLSGGTQTDSDITVSISRTSSTFTHGVWWRVGSGGWNTVTTNATTNSSFKVPHSAFPNSTSGTITVAFQTYSGSTKVGNEQHITRALTVPATVVPSLTAITATENVTQVASLVGAFVKGKSKLNLAITGASGAGGSTITGYRITLPGTTINASSGVSNLLTTSGNVVITGTVTDSRGRTSESKTLTINVLDYKAPTLTGMAFYRSNSAGVADPTGTYVTVKGTVTVSSLIVGTTQKNKVWYESQHDKTGSFVSFEYDQPNVITKSYTNILPSFTVDKSFNFRSRAGDIFVWGGWSVGVVPSGEVTQQWGRKTTSFGKMIDDTSYNVQVGTGGIQSEGNLELGNILSTETHIRMHSGAKENRIFWRESDGHFGFYMHGDDGVMKTRLRYDGKDWSFEGSGVKVGTSGIQSDGPIIDKNGDEVTAVRIYSKGVNVSGTTSYGGDLWIGNPGTNNSLLVVNLRTVNGEGAESYRVNTYLYGNQSYIRLFNSSGAVVPQADITFNYVIYLL